MPKDKRYRPTLDEDMVRILHRCIRAALDTHLFELHIEANIARELDKMFTDKIKLDKALKMVEEMDEEV